MTSIEDTRWRHLVDEHAFDQIEFTLDQRTQRVRPFALTAGATGVAAAASPSALAATVTAPLRIAKRTPSSKAVGTGGAVCPGRRATKAPGWSHGWRPGAGPHDRANDGPDNMADRHGLERHRGRA
jgi:hypothetical protein